MRDTIRFFPSNWYASQPCLAHSLMALNELNLSQAQLIMGQMKKTH